MKTQPEWEEIAGEARKHMEGSGIVLTESEGADVESIILSAIQKAHTAGASMEREIDQHLVQVEQLRRERDEAKKESEKWFAEFETMNDLYEKGVVKKGALRAQLKQARDALKKAFEALGNTKPRP